MRNFKLIDKYVQGQLSFTDTEAFERQLLADAGLQEELNKYKLSLQVIDYMIHQSTKEKLKLIDKEYEAVGHQTDKLIGAGEPGIPIETVAAAASTPVGATKVKPGSKIFSIKSFRPIAAIMTLAVVSVIGIYFFVQSEKSFSEVTAENIEYVDVSLSRGGSNEMLEQIQAMEADRKYMEAINFMERKIKQDQELQKELAFYLAQDYFRLMDFEKAGAYNDIVINDTSHMYYENALLLQLFIAIETKSSNLTSTIITQLRQNPNFSMYQKLDQIERDLKINPIL